MDLLKDTFTIKNASGAVIAKVNYQELMQLKAQGVIRPDDRIYDSKWNLIH